MYVRMIFIAMHTQKLEKTNLSATRDFEIKIVGILSLLECNVLQLDCPYTYAIAQHLDPQRIDVLEILSKLCVLLIIYNLGCPACVRVF